MNVRPHHVLNLVATVNCSSEVSEGWNTTSRLVEAVDKNTIWSHESRPVDREWSGNEKQVEKILNIGPQKEWWSRLSKEVPTFDIDKGYGTYMRHSNLE